VGGTSKHAAWLAALDQAPVGSQSRLMDVALDGPPRYSLRKLERMAELPPDPRVASRVWSWLRDVPIPGTGGRPFYRACARVLIQIDDDRFDDAIATALTSDHTTGSYTVARLRRVGVRTALQALRDLAAHVEARGYHPDPTAEEAAVIAELDAAVTVAVRRAATSVASEESLLAAVFADPAADEPRLVYADLLQERGDPRGELIALQIERARGGGKPSRQERSLIKKYGEAIVGALEPYVLKSGREFRRGFLAACRYKDETRGNPSVGLPGWATVEAIDVSPHVFVSGTYELLSQPHMKVLERVRGMTHQDFVKLCGCPRPLPITSLHLRRADIARMIEPLRKSVAFPDLRTIDLRDVADRSEIERLRTAVGSGVEVL